MLLIKKIKFMNINFLSIGDKNIKKLVKRNGLFIFPLGPGFAILKKNSSYHKSLINAAYVFLIVVFLFFC